MSVISSEACLPVSGPNSKLTCFCGAFEHVRFVLRPVCSQPAAACLAELVLVLDPPVPPAAAQDQSDANQVPAQDLVGCLTPVRWVL